MASEVHFQGQTFEAETDDPKPTSAATDFDCSICLDSAQDAVVTFCGHLYCWPCIYKWIHQQSTSAEDDRVPQCPVCKAEVSERALVPLYGRGQSSINASGFGPTIPSRARGPACGDHTPQQDDGYDYAAEPEIGLDGAGSNALHPMIGIIGDMIYARPLRNPQAYGQSYPGRGSRARTRVMKADQSLSRLSLFLCYCLVFCLLFF